MNSDRDNEQVTEQDGVTAEEASPETGVEPGLEDLMSAKEAVASDDVDLDARALEAAETALASAERALADARAAVPDSPAIKRLSKRRQRILRAILLVNFGLMGVMLAIPDPVPEAAAPEGGASATAQEQDQGEMAMPNGDLYTQALMLASQGRFDPAIQVLQEYLQRAPHLPAPIRRRVFDAMSHYSFKAGHRDQALEYARQATSVTQGHFLPSDLIEMAHQAELEGNTEEMRRLYARFLLQQKQIPPALQRYVVEAYLKLGDSYRLQATAAEEQARIDAIEELNRKFREEQAKSESARPPKGGH